MKYLVINNYDSGETFVFIAEDFTEEQIDEIFEKNELRKSNSEWMVSNKITFLTSKKIE